MLQDEPEEDQKLLKFIFRGDMIFHFCQDILRKNTNIYLITLFLWYYAMLLLLFSLYLLESTLWLFVCERCSVNKLYLLTSWWR